MSASSENQLMVEEFHIEVALSEQVLAKNVADLAQFLSKITLSGTQRDLRQPGIVKPCQVQYKDRIQYYFLSAPGFQYPLQFLQDFLRDMYTRISANNIKKAIWSILEIRVNRPYTLILETKDRLSALNKVLENFSEDQQSRSRAFVKWELKTIGHLVALLCKFQERIPQLHLTSFTVRSRKKPANVVGAGLIETDRFEGDIEKWDTECLEDWFHFYEKRFVKRLKLDDTQNRLVNMTFKNVDSRPIEKKTKALETHEQYMNLMPTVKDQLNRPYYLDKDSEPSYQLPVDANLGNPCYKTSFQTFVTPRQSALQKISENWFEPMKRHFSR